ncbi:hypothetical protein [Hymenobacter defluvii]|uniref:Uncharacterized protein n=1 Tax=Hymenobacter defluvii TaxID=2054411 RepID=A0ABS3THU5_9BACT|nr:hypothetical protein [Hymenobacter defluvii]MBO3272159.1 hypothetical protein [Hymenobacter defluvii]
MRKSCYFLLGWLVIGMECSTSSGITEHRAPDYRASQVHSQVTPRIPPHQQRHMEWVQEQLRQGKTLTPRDNSLVRKYLPDHWPTTR